MPGEEVVVPVPDDRWIGRCVNCLRGGAIKWRNWCLRCGAWSMLCRDCASDPDRTALGRSCAECFGQHSYPDSSGPGGLVPRQRVGKGKTSS
jgi:hypothetical protein